MSMAISMCRSRCVVSLWLWLSVVVVSLSWFPFQHLHVDAVATGDVTNLAAVTAPWGGTVCTSLGLAFFTSDDSRIRSVPIAGGSVNVIDNGAVGSGHRGITCMQATNMLYIAAVGSGRIYSIPATGGTLTQIATITAAHDIQAMSDGSGILYVRPYDKTGRVYKIDTLNSNTVTFITVNGLTAQNGQTISINPITYAAYFAQEGQNVIYKVPDIRTADGVTVTTLVSGLGTAAAYAAVDGTGTYLYVSDTAQPLRFREIRLSDNTVTVINPSSSITGTRATHLTVNGQYLYFQTYETQQAYRMYTRAASIQGDPQFVGLQGQQYQVHGIPDEIFNLITSPQLHINSMFSLFDETRMKPATPCDKHSDICYSHPGTYLTSTGILMKPTGQSHTTYCKVTVEMNHSTQEYELNMQIGQHPNRLTSINTTMMDKYVFSADGVMDQIHTHDAENVTSHHHSHSFIHLISSHEFMIHIHQHMSITFSLSSDGFLNLGIELLNAGLLTAGHHRTIVKQSIYDISQSYPSYPLHGLIGQTWKNIQYVTPEFVHYYEGTIDEYVLQEQQLFSTNYPFNQF